MNFARDVVEAARTAPGAGRAGARRAPGASGPSARSRDARRALARRASHARGVRPRRRRADADRQPPGVGARDGRLLPPALVVLPCTEQLRAKDLRLRLEVGAPRADRRRRAQRATSSRRAPAECEVDAACPDERAVRRAEPAPAVELDARGPVPDHVHERHGRRAEGRRCTASATSPASALQAEHWLGAARRASSSGARPPAAGRSRPATCSSRRGCAARRRCCTTRASTRTSASSCSRASASTCSAWRRPSTA